MRKTQKNITLDPFTIQKALTKGRYERSRAFHAMWKSVTAAIR